ncbi:tetratricopeptide repeat protein [Paenibacillus glufosinatiresistens]|uniref:tetratricopeptide repeat protein n=1 Tax=Paenibacillus glufosinatiresistens TaxID=3070657 RepID=UPI00286D74E6|nr:tetratricopeptide repeat protein [Paenibacillus sp. YX.27]
MIEQTSERGGESGKLLSVTLDAHFFFERAVRSLDKLQYDKALRNFRKAVEYEPENPVNHCNMAGILSEMGDYQASNEVLAHVLEAIDPAMTECHFYMANNYANMEQFEQAERSLIAYLEEDPSGEFLAESEELMELLRHELDRPVAPHRIKSREGMAEHEQARTLLEEGQFPQAVQMLEEIVEKVPDFLAAHNNLALAHFYMGRFARAKASIARVLELEPGNLHALCNLAIFLQYEGKREETESLLCRLENMLPFHEEHVFKLATTMGILGRHRAAYGHFRRLLKSGEAGADAVLLHYCAAAACNSGLYAEAERRWRQAGKADPDSAVPGFYLAQLGRSAAAGEPLPPVSYNYQLPFQEQLKQWKDRSGSFAEQARSNPLLRSSFFWALRYGDTALRRQVLEALDWIGDNELAEVLRELAQQPLPTQGEEVEEAALSRLHHLIGMEPS